ncbi:MAG: hypothetical protein JWR72_548 [Flavisolibacter sp.]|nr:hypothetical protein [Flavisolibacter sp.]
MTAVNALAAGYCFMVEPSGEGLGIKTDHLKHSPFTSFFIPGIVLFIANGVLSIFTAIIAIKEKKTLSVASFIPGMYSSWLDRYSIIDVAGLSSVAADDGCNWKLFDYCGDGDKGSINRSACLRGAIYGSVALL